MFNKKEARTFLLIGSEKVYISQRVSESNSTYVGYRKVIRLENIYRKQLWHVTELCQFDKERETLTKYTGFLIWQLQISWWRLKSSYDKLHAYKPPQQIFLHYCLTFILNVSKL